MAAEDFLGLSLLPPLYLDNVRGGRMKRVGIALLTIGIALTLCGCGGERQSVPEPDDADSSVVGNGQKVAGSMEEYIDQALS